MRSVPNSSGSSVVMTRDWRYGEGSSMNCHSRCGLLHILFLIGVIAVSCGHTDINDWYIFCESSSKIYMCIGVCVLGGACPSIPTPSQKSKKGWRKSETILQSKGKAVPLWSWTGPVGSRRLRLSDFKTFGT